jgi:hypothetical protein
MRTRFEHASGGFLVSHRQFMVMTVSLQLLIAAVVVLYVIGG